jgi:glycosyltransferase involved in cell wall biosynthesis
MPAGRAQKCHTAKPLAIIVMPELAVVISYYKALDNLRIILKALSRQSCMDFEVIVSEDDNNQETIEYIINAQTEYVFPIMHLNQEVKDGFKKSYMLNKAITSCHAEKIAFIDGDCVPHRNFVKEYVKRIDNRSFCVGRAVMLDKITTEKVKEEQSLTSLKFSHLLFSNSRKTKDGIYFPLFPLTLKVKKMVGRNWGCCKESLLNINGFDQDYIYAGVSEDTDIEWRLIGSGLRRKSVKNKAIVYHLYHDRWYSSKDERRNYDIMKRKMEDNKIRCLNGITAIGNKT